MKDAVIKKIFGGGWTPEWPRKYAFWSKVYSDLVATLQRDPRLLILADELRRKGQTGTQVGEKAPEHYPESSTTVPSSGPMVIDEASFDSLWTTVNDLDPDGIGNDAVWVKLRQEAAMLVDGWIENVRREFAFKVQTPWPYSSGGQQ